MQNLDALGLPLWWSTIQEGHFAAVRLLQEPVQRYKDTCTERGRIGMHPCPSIPPVARGDLSLYRWRAPWDTIDCTELLKLISVGANSLDSI